MRGTPLHISTDFYSSSHWTNCGEKGLLFPGQKCICSFLPKDENVFLLVVIVIFFNNNQSQFLLLEIEFHYPRPEK